MMYRVCSSFFHVLIDLNSNFELIFLNLENSLSIMRIMNLLQSEAPVFINNLSNLINLIRYTIFPFFLFLQL